MTAIRVELELADGQFVSRMIHAGETVGQFQQNVARGSAALTALNQAGLGVISSVSRADQASRGFLSTLRDVSIVTGMLSLGISKAMNLQNSWIGSIVRINAEFEKLNFQMQGMARSADPIREAGQNVAWLREKAMEMPFSLKAITDGFVRLNATGIDPTKGALDALADGITAFGGGEEQMKRTLVGISQMSGKGVVQMEEMRQQIAEHMPRAMELMARSMGVSMAQLIKDISTGRVAAGASLEAFFGELERTFGGRAAQMMQTFNGQLQRTKTQLELLATSDTIRLEFFDGALKDQLADLNAFLTSPRAQAYADQLGQAMAKGVTWVRAAIDQLIAFRREIGNVAQAAAYVFGANLLFKGLGAMGGALGSLRNELKLVSLQFTMAGAAQNAYTIAANSGAPPLIRLSRGFAAVTASMRGLMMGAAAFAPWIAGLGLAVYAAGQYFGWFGDRVGDAYNDLVRFGAESRAQAQETSQAHIAALEARLAAMKNAATMSSSGKWSEEIQQVEKELADARARQGELLLVAGEREDTQMLTRFSESVERKLNLVKSGYDREMIAAEKYYNDLANTTRDKGGDVQKIEDDRREAYAKAQKKFYEDQIRELEGMILWEESVETYAEGVKKKQSQQRLDMLRARLRQESEALRSFKAADVPLLAKLDDPNSAYDKGSKLFARLQEDIAGVKAEIQGASPELAKLQEMLRTNKFGDMGREEVQALAADIRNATAELEQFEELRKGQKDAERDLKQIEDRLFDREMDLLEKKQGKTITEGERFILRMENGAYKGLGPASQIAKALEGVYGRLDIAGSKSNQLGETLRTNAFGDQSQGKIQGVNEKLRETALILDQIGQGLNGINFSGFNASGIAGMAGGFGASTALPVNVPKDMSDRMAQAMQILMEKGWSQIAASGIVGNLAGESSLNPNARNKGDGSDGSDSIGVAQWNSNRARALQQFAAMRGSNWNDFRTQIEFVDWELRNTEASAGSAIGLARSPEAASEMFMRKYERPAEWAIRESGPKRAGYAKTAYGLGGGGASSQPAAETTPIVNYNPELEAQIQERVRVTEKLTTAAQTLSQRENDILTGEQQQGRADYLKELKDKAEQAAKGIEGTGKNLSELQDKIKSGTLGSKDLAAPEYKELIAAAKELDKIEEDRRKKKSAMSKADQQTEEFSRRQIELARRVEEANARMLDPLEQKSSTAYRALRQDLDDYLSDVQRAYGQESTQYQQALDFRAAMLRQHRNMEVAENGAKWAKNTADINRGLMSESQRRQLALQEEIARIDAEVAAFQGSEAEKVQIVAAAEAQKAALRKQAAAAASPITGMMQQWGDLQTNLANATQQWMGSLADGLTNLIMGTGDLRSVIQGILKDVVNMGLKYLMSQMMGGKSQSGASGAKGAAGKTGKAATSAATGGKGKMFPIRHTGGLVNASGVYKAVNPSVFVGAQKYHTGGIIGGPKLSRGEVPIIAKEGEGVFTPEQMANMGGFNQTSFQINAPVQVNGSAGTPEQNQDLAKRVAKQMEDTFRGIAADEMRKQTRPGNFANSRSR
ncbi:phage tail tip lysozyme [Shinella zoogloeoides]|uniref:phage tail tip lysozyme n=1 Tax=Shinella zoogloeoides TaxID=352475 RepID=UPI00273D210C|nr:phage tail tip lysozyme [Shinella zoogloeoides]WLR91004.1 phage tail tip lysozyme [Shinella zoogloeoides]